MAPPPTSRKLAGVPPCSLMMSMVAMARPAPFTENQKVERVSDVGPPASESGSAAPQASLTQAADGPVQADVVEVGLGSLPVPGVLLAPVPQGKDLLLTVLSVGVKVDLSVHAHDWGVRGGGWVENRREERKEEEGGIEER